jgi:hypothetical protein
VRTRILIESENEHTPNLRQELVNALTETAGVICVNFEGLNTGDEGTSTIMLMVEHANCQESQRFAELLCARDTHAHQLRREALERRYLEDRLQALLMPGLLAYELTAA